MPNKNNLFTASNINYKTGLIIGKVYDGGLVLFDTFKSVKGRTNSNCLIICKSGTGKNYSVNLVCNRGDNLDG